MRSAPPPPVGVAYYFQNIPSFEVICFQIIGMLLISYKDHVTNEEVRAKIQQAIGPHEDPLTVVKRRKLQWYGHVSRSSRLAKTILQGTVKGWKDRADRGRGGKTTSGKGQAWSSQVPEGSGEQIKWRKLVVKSSVVPQRPSRFGDR